MLIDTCLNNRIENVAPARGVLLRGRLNRAQKFELAPDFAAAAEELGMDLKTIANAFGHCRLPYETTWIEVAQAHRPQFMAAGVHIPALQHEPNRVGFLLEATSPQLDQFDIFLFWDLKKSLQRPQASHITLHFDPKAMAPEDWHDDAQERSGIFGIKRAPEWTKVSEEVRKRLTAALQPSYTPFVDPVLQGGHGDYADQFIYELGAADWAGEAHFIMATLALLNTLNATERVLVNNSRLNHARARQRRPGFCDYHVLKIHPRIKQRIEGDAHADGHRELRAHLVRGHFKVRKSGIYFWRPHARGIGKLLEKSYKVT